MVQSTTGNYPQTGVSGSDREVGAQTETSMEEGTTLGTTEFGESSRETIARYLQDVIAAERTFESQLRTFAKEGDDRQAQRMFEQHAEETKRQYQRLEVRLQQLGDTTGAGTTWKSFIGHLAGVGPKIAQIGQYDAEVSTQNLIMAYAVESSEVATYEALAQAAAAAGDAETEALAREIQDEERETAAKVWDCLVSNSREAFHRVREERGEND